MARSFNGTDQSFYADRGTGAPTGLATGTSFSMACWVNFAAFPGSGSLTFLGKGFDGTDTNYFFQVDSTPTVQVGAFNGTTQGVNGSYTAGTGVWTHIYGDWNGSVWSIWFNGNSQASGSTTGPSVIVNPRYFVMAAADATGTAGSFTQWTNCSLADCAVWSGPLNSTDIGNISGKTLGGGPNSAGRASTATNTGRTLLGYWPLNGSTNTETDHSANGINATGSGATSPGVVADPIQLQPFGFTAVTLMGAICM
jgi:hypothetical protein